MFRYFLGTIVVLALAMFFLPSGNAAMVDNYDLVHNVGGDVYEMVGYECFPTTGNETPNKPRADIERAGEAHVALLNNEEASNVIRVTPPGTGGWTTPDPNGGMQNWRTYNDVGTVAHAPTWWGAGVSGDNNDPEPWLAEGDYTDTAFGAQSTSLGPAGWIMGRLEQPAINVPGTFDIFVDENAVIEAYCVYGAVDPDGPFFYIGTRLDNAGSAPTDADENEYFDLEDEYMPWSELLLGAPHTTVEYLMILDSSGAVPDITVDFTYAPGSPVLTKTDITFTDTTFIPQDRVQEANKIWTFYDGTIASGAPVMAGGPGGGITGTSVIFDFPDGMEAPTYQQYEVCLTVTDDLGNSGTECKILDIQNRPPEVNFITATENCIYGVAMDFLADTTDSPAGDPDGFVDTYFWDFGDGDTSSDIAPNHAFPQPGNYVVSLTITDDDGATDTHQHLVEVNCSPPDLQPIPYMEVDAGQLVSFMAIATDADGSPLEYVASEQIILPTGALWYDNGDGTADFWWQTDEDDVGTYSGNLFHVREVFYNPFFDSELFTIKVMPPESPPEQEADADLDGAPKSQDNCPAHPNPGQSDADGDGIGDDCDQTPFPPPPPCDAPCEPVCHDCSSPPAQTSPDADEDEDESTDDAAATVDTSVESPPPGVADSDADGIADELDNCPETPNSAQDDQDRDGFGDVCDLDLDGDGIAQFHASGAALDNCPLHANASQADQDGDGSGDACDPQVNNAQVTWDDLQEAVHVPCRFDIRCTPSEMADDEDVSNEAAASGGTRDGGIDRVWFFVIGGAALLAAATVVGLLARRR